MPKQKLVTIVLTDEQFKKLKSLFAQAKKAKKAGARGIILGQPGLTLETGRIVRFTFIEHETACEIIRLVNPKAYELNQQMGFIERGKTK